MNKILLLFLLVASPAFAALNDVTVLSENASAKKVERTFNLTAAGIALLDDGDATAQKATLGITQASIAALLSGGTGTMNLAGYTLGLTASKIEDSTSVGRTLLTAASATAQRTALSVNKAPNIVFEGDSLTDDAGLTGPTGTWPRQLLIANPFLKAANYYNQATSGNTSAQMVSQYAAQVQPYATSQPGGAFFFLWGGTNGLAATTAAAVYDELKSLWASARADGFIVVAFKVSPRTDFSGATETKRTDLNNLIASDPSLYDYLIDTEIVAGTSDTSDGLHFTAAANLRIARLVQDTLFRGEWLANGTGSPEGVVSGNIGKIYQRYNGAAGTTIYWKSTGTGTTGWVSLGTLATQSASSVAITGGTITGLTSAMTLSDTSQTPLSITSSNSSNNYLQIDSTNTNAFSGFRLSRSGLNRFLQYIEATTDDLVIYDQLRSSEVLHIIRNGNMRLMPLSGEVLIGTTTDAGAFALQVPGAALFGTTTATTSTTTTATIGTANLSVLTGNLTHSLSGGAFYSPTWTGATGTTGTIIRDSTNTGVYLNDTYKSAGVNKWYVGKNNDESYDFYNVNQARSALNLPTGGGINIEKTNTLAGTTGDRTINRATGTVNFAAAAASLVVTNNQAKAETSSSVGSIIQVTVRTNDTTMKSATAVCTADGSFTIYPNAAPTAETKVNFTVTN